MKAVWNSVILAESNDTVVVESNHYFPVDSLNSQYFIRSASQTHCPWKGDASYYTLVVEGKENLDAAWYYPDPKDAAKHILHRVAFWKGVVVSE